MVLTLRDSYKQEVFDFTCICDFHYWNDTVHAHVEKTESLNFQSKPDLATFLQPVCQKTYTLLIYSKINRPKRKLSVR